MTPPTQHLRGSSWLAALLVALVASGAYVAYSSVNLGAQGAYYDELNKAVASFAWLDRPSPMFSHMQVAGIPTMVMPYKAAAKASIYGPYMLLTGQPFTIESWRLMGLILVACGFLAFCLLARRALPWWGLGVLAVLLFTDQNVLVASRHDWGPIAFGLMLRLCIVGLWLGGQARVDGGSTRNTFFIAALIGFGVFEKLNAVVLLLPFALFILCDSRRRNLRHVLVGFAGGVVGGLPLIAANVRSWIEDGHLISLRALEGAARQSGSEFLRVSSGYLSLGTGAPIREQVFAELVDAWRPWTEGSLLSLGLVMTLLFVFGRRHPLAATVRILVVSYLCLSVCLYLLPATSEAQHWALGTPFQYAALAVALVVLTRSSSDRGFPRRLLVLGVVLVALVGQRVPDLLQTHRAFVTGRHSTQWDPAISEFATYLAKKPSDHGVIAAGWGVATQIFCFAQGRQQHVDELFWSYNGLPHLQRFVSQSKKRVFYVVTPASLSGLRMGNTKEIIDDLQHLEGWRIAPLEADLPARDILKILRIERTE